MGDYSESKQCKKKRKKEIDDDETTVPATE
jgi:hypothetical protein